MSNGQPRRKRPQRGVKKAVLAFMNTRVGLYTTCEEVHEAIAHKFDPPLDLHQVGQGLSSLHVDKVLRRVGRGVYLLQPSNHSDEDHVYETVGQLTDGTVIVRSDDGILYTVDPLRKETQ